MAQPGIITTTRQTTVTDAEVLCRFYRDNADHLRPWEPLRESGYHSIANWQQRLADREREQAAGRAAHFISCDADSGDVLAVCNLSNIVRGVFQACNIGYASDEGHQRQGVMSQLCTHAIDYAFEELQLNRIMANYMPANHRSAALLKKLGFTREGVARKYLCINGRWEDHVLTSLINPRNQ